jgi:Thymidine kinase
LALADRVDKLLAVCRKCGSDFACRTQRTVHSSEQILVGDAQYEARCIHCFDPPSDYQMQLHLALSQRESPQLTLVGKSTEPAVAAVTNISNFSPTGEGVSPAISLAAVPAAAVPASAVPAVPAVAAAPLAAEALP